MGGIFAKSPEVGRWLSGAPVRQEDVAAINSAVASGKFVHVGRLEDLSDGFEVVCCLFDSEGGSDYYAKKMDGFTAWWYRNQSALISKAAADAGIRADMASKIVAIALPQLMLSGDAAARAAVSRELGSAAASGTVIDILARGIADTGVSSARSADGITNFGHRYYAAAKSAKIGGGSPILGSCGCSGGDELSMDTVKEYVDTANSKTKTKIIEDILSIADTFELNTSGNTPAERVKSLLGALPAGKSIRAATENQKRICAKLASAINRTYGNEIIQPDAAPEIVCQQVAELLSSLAAGMHSEFLAVYADARRILQNLHILRSALNDDHSAIMQKVKADSDMSANVASLDDLHKILMDEVDRQIAMMMNLLNVQILPADRDLTTLIHNKKNVAGYIEKIDARVGSGKFGEVIANILRGLGMTANFALLIERSLKTIGMTVAEYAKSPSLQTLREKIANGLVGKEMKDDELHEYLRAAELLYKNFHRHSEIGEFITKQGTTGAHDDAYTGGVSEYADSVLDKRIKDRKKMRDLIFGTFYRQVNDLFDNMVSAINFLTMKVGTEIPLSEQLNSFREILQRINTSMIRKKGIYYALIGYFNDALSRSKKDEILSELKMLSAQLDTLLEMPLYAPAKQYFVAVQQQITAIVALVEKYSDEIAAKFGRGENAAPAEKTGGDDGDDENIAHDGGVSGGLDDDWSRTEMSEISHKLAMRTKNSKTVGEAIQQFDYRYRVAQIFSNLKASSSELAHYGEKYGKNVSQSIANILGDDKKVYDALHKELADASSFGDLEGYIVSNAAGFHSIEEVSAQRAAAVKILEHQWDVKKKFWATVEAVDTYMQVFTDALVKNPTDVKEIKSMLDDVDIINNWYTEKTGETVASVFDYFPSMFVHSAGDSISDATIVYPPADMTEITDEHYYAKIKKSVTEKSSMPPVGNPGLVTMPSRGWDAMNRARKALHELGVLKNILSVFSNVGARFGGEEIRKKVFMTPTQMYSNIVDYMVMSSFAQGFGTGPLTVDASGALPAFFSDASGVSALYDPFRGTTLPHSKQYAQSIRPNKRTVVLGVTIDAAARASLSRDPLSSAAIDAINHVSNYANHAASQAMSQVNALGNDVAALTGNQYRPAAVADAITIYPPAPVTSQERALIFKKRWGVWMRSCDAGARSHEGFSFSREDDYFVLVMKAMAAKILTVTGLYDVFDRPAEFNGLSPIRMIIGGADETPKIISEAVPLYLRLPLLAQFYRNIFGFSNTGPEESSNRFQSYNEFHLNPEHQTLKISMVPDVDGTFAGLIRIVFRKNKFLNEADYSDEDLRELIREINLVYQRVHEKHPTNTVTAAIDEFVAEINRRYGIVTQSDRDSYEREFGQRYDYPSEGPDTTDRYTEDPDTPNIAILPGETDDEMVMPSGAQKLLGERFDVDFESKKSRYGITLQHRDLVYRFRCAIDKFFEGSTEQFTFAHAIKAAQIKLRHEQGDDARFNVISALLRGDNIYSKVESMKCILFHETVVSGLNVLSAMHSMLAKFKRRVHVIDITTIEDVIWAFFAENGPKRETGLHAAMMARLVALGIINPDNAQTLALVQGIFGRAEAAEWNGGHMPAAGNPYALRGDNGVPISSNGRSGHVMRFPTDNATPDWVGGGTSAASTLAVVDGVITLSGDASNPLANPQGGLVTVIAGQTATALRAAYSNPRQTAANADTRQRAETLMRFLPSQSFLMRELIEAIYGISSDFQGLVTFKFEHGKLLLGYGGLKTLIEETFQHVRYFMDLLKPHVSPEVYNRYSAKTSPGSFYWLQEQLMEKIIIGRPAEHRATNSTTNAAIGYANIDELMRKLTATYAYLTREWSVDGAMFGVGSMYSDQAGIGCNVNAITSASPNRRNKFDKIFASMIFYDGTKPQSGIIRSSDTTSPVDGAFGSIGGIHTIDALHNPFDALHFVGPAKSRTLDTRFSCARFGQLYTWKDEFTYNRSAMFAFNQLVAKFIQTFYDTSNNKIYGGLINQFANGAFNQAIIDPLHTYPDTVPVWMTKHGSTRHDVPNALAVLASLPETPVVTLDARELSEIVDQYIKFGVAPGDADSADVRRRLLDPKNSINMETWPAFNLAAGGTVTPLGIWGRFALHLACRLIHEQFKLESNDARPLNSQKDALLCLGALPMLDGAGNALSIPQALTNIGTVGAARQIYASGSIRDIVQAVFGGGNQALVYRLSILLQGSTVLTTGTGVSYRTLNAPNTVIGDTISQQPASPGAAKMNGLAEAFAKNMSVIAIPTKPLGEALSYALSIFPFQSDAVGRSNASTEYSAELYAAIVVRIARDIIQNAPTQTDTAVAALLEPIAAAVMGTSVRATYAVPHTAQPKFIVTEEDMLVANNEVLSGGRPGIGADENILSFVPETEIDDLKVPRPQKFTPGNNNFGNRADPAGVLFASLSMVLKSLITSRNSSNQTLVYLSDIVADIPLYMKEKMRANLPAFRNLFKELVARCELLKRFMTDEHLNLSRVHGAAATGYNTTTYEITDPDYNPWPYVLRPAVGDSAAAKTRFSSILDSITSGCAALIAGCDQALRDVGDDPKYFELYSGSIKDYKAQNNVDPLMPLSSVLAVLKNTEVIGGRDSAMDFFPLHTLGSDNFKFLYGVRSLLGNPSAKPSTDHATGYTDIISGFNMQVDNKLQVSPKEAEGYFSCFVRMVRLLFEMKHNKGLLTPYIFVDGLGASHPNTVNDGHWLSVGGSFVRDDLVLTNTEYGTGDPRTPGVQHNVHGSSIGAGTNDSGPVVLTNRSDVSIVADFDQKRDKHTYAAPAYSITHSIADIVRMTESSFRDERIKELVEYICKLDPNRRGLEVQNIIDLGIVPINVHALQRGIPLANLYNYAYTYDRLVIELYYGLHNDNAAKLIGELCGHVDTGSRMGVGISGGFGAIRSSRDMLVAMLLNPYMSVFQDLAPNGIPSGMNMYEEFVKPMLAGVSGSDNIGRPRFLSDQIYNKVIFGELYESPADYNELGPAATHVNKKDDVLATLLVELTMAISQHLNSNRFVGFATQLPQAAWVPVLGAIVNRVMREPSVPFTTLVTTIKDMLELRWSLPSASSSVIAVIMCAEVILIHKTLVVLVNRQGTPFRRLAIIVANTITRALLALNAIGGDNNHCVIGGTTPAVAYQNMIALIDNAARSGDASMAVKSGQSEDMFFGSILAEAVSNIASIDNSKLDLSTLSTYVGNVNISSNGRGARIYTVIVDQLVAAKTAVNGADSAFITTESGTSRRSLHWLSSNAHAASPDELAAEGAHLQPLPYGDNSVHDRRQVQSVDLDANMHSMLSICGRLRFDTIFVRNLVFITNLYRALRSKLHNDLMYNRNLVLSSAPIVRPELTEFRGNDIVHRNSPSTTMNERYRF